MKAQKIDMTDIVADTSLTSTEKLQAESERIAESVGITLEELAMYQELLAAAEEPVEEVSVDLGKTTMSTKDSGIISTFETVVDPLEIAQQKVDEYYEAFRASYMATAAYVGAGSGTAADPYIITTPEQLAAMADDLAAAYVFGADIDLSGIDWTPIGSSVAAPFTGTLDGRHYIIRGLSVNSSDGYGGLFRSISGTAAGIILEDVVISTTGQYAGGLCGVLNTAGRVYDCSVTGAVAATTRAGGITGLSYGGIARSCFDGNVTSTNFAGGITADHQGSSDPGRWITDCYSSGTITSTSYVGGIAGRLLNSGDIIDRCYSAAIINGISGASTTRVASIAGSQGASTQIKNSVGLSATLSSAKTGYDGRIAGEVLSGAVFVNNYANAAMTLNGVTATSGTTTNKNGADVDSATYHTRSFWEDTVGFVFRENGGLWRWSVSLQLPVLFDSFAGGSGTVDDPYIIKTAYQLMNINDAPYANFVVANDIDLSGIANFVPLGNSTTPFTGVFDGASHIISNLTITSVASYRGLFGYVTSGEVKKIILMNPVITCGGYSGSLIGYLGPAGNVYRCAVIDCDITKTSGYFVGGLIGEVGGEVTDVYVTGKITGLFEGTAGIAGRVINSTGLIQNAYSDCTVTSTGNANGGIVGQHTYGGKIINCVAIGKSVNGSAGYSFRISGYKAEGSTNINCYANSAMLINGVIVTSVDPTVNNGANVSLDIYTTISFWRDTMGWNISDDLNSSSIWVLAPNGLPVFRDQFSLEIIVPANGTNIQTYTPITFEGMVTNNSPYDSTTAEWNFGDGSIAEGLAATHTYLRHGELTVTLGIGLSSKTSIILFVDKIATWVYESAFGQRIFFDNEKYSVLRAGISGMSGATAESTLIETPNTIGELFRPVKFSRRDFGFEVLTLGESREELEARRIELATALNPYQGEGKLIWHRDNGDIYYIKCVPASGYPNFKDGTKPGTEAKQWLADLEFIAADPCWYANDPVVLTGNGIIHNAGNLPVGAIITLGRNGAANETIGKTIQPAIDANNNPYDLTGIVVTTVDNIIDVRDTNGNSAAHMIKPIGSTFWKAYPGDNQITGAQRVEIRPKWTGI